jgi:hypothetical protein
MTTAMDFLETGLCRRRCEDHSNDLENPLLVEATAGENKQEGSKVHPSTTPPHPTKRLMLALFFALSVENIAFTIAIQISSQDREMIPLIHLVGGKLIGVMLTCFLAGMAAYFLAAMILFFQEEENDEEDEESEEKSTPV